MEEIRKYYWLMLGKGNTKQRACLFCNSQRGPLALSSVQGLMEFQCRSDLKFGW